MGSACRMKYKFLGSPLGKIEISGCEAGVHRIKLLEKRFQRPDSSSPDSHEASFAGECLEGPREVVTALDKCAAWLEAYFYAPERLGDLPLPAFHHPLFQQDSFRRQVLWKLVTAVKLGDTISYQQLAALVGKSRAARAVGGVMRDNPVPIIIPCHRVIYSNGRIGNYTGGVGVKEWLLDHEKHLKRKWAN
ncbi:methylated-DNA--protein-cysteine methyltransferase [Dromiciops gliroides]|uniref:methylated-DNA--protein-cysteine methyltransferase n=1 Tax=Dromiciops gliroides TaxID=33562 RepID=UPI001CC6174E|nr:methylated-DNA--protein-cysteine methyltransferase [Dromiciops gliroides]XP_043842757.1 methylated-DNA--protein-cysteine methyltransferase [Dromiciops gliroides]